MHIIEKMNFASYFLINWDIIKYAQHKNYYYVGRGSGANSMIAYLLRITDVDPIELDLYFERFINENRSNPPDFDIDFSWTDRDDITRYIFERFGPERTALLATYATYKDDAVIRELGKVFGLPPNEIEHLQYLKERKLQPEENFAQLIFKYSWQKYQRAFAAEFLCSIDSLTSFLNGDFSSYAVEEAAYQFDVSEQTVTSLLLNNGYIHRDWSETLPYRTAA